MERETSALRQERGVQQLAALMTYWLAHNLSQDKLAALVAWAYGESSGFDGGAMSRIKNAKQSRGAGLRHLDALAETNRAIWVWQSQGERAAIQQFGLHSDCGVRPEWINDTIWLPKAGDESKPLDLGDFALLVMGRLELPYLGTTINASDRRRASDRLSELLDQIARERSWGPREATERFTDAYPPASRVRRARLRELLLGERLTPAELESELAAMAEMIRQIRGLQTFTPAQLKAELLSDRR
ncbi:MAG: hypothetical protein ACO3FA_09790 [Vulcanococcus sp.]